jgi:hypothetical protein
MGTALNGCTRRNLLRAIRDLLRADIVCGLTQQGYASQGAAQERRIHKYGHTHACNQFPLARMPRGRRFPDHSFQRATLCSSRSGLFPNRNRRSQKSEAPVTSKSSIITSRIRRSTEDYIDLIGERQVLIAVCIEIKEQGFAGQISQRPSKSFLSSMQLSPWYNLTLGFRLKRARANP